MAETGNIEDMAKKVADEVFDIFGWTRVGSRDRNWACKIPERHGQRHTHPSDAVFSYEDPYSPRTIFVNTDLKALKKSNIRADRIFAAIESLAQSLECIDISEEWQLAYTTDGRPWEAVALLFVYNTDGEYDASKFSTILDASAELDCVPQGKRIFAVGPGDVSFLFVLANDLVRCRDKYKASIEYFYAQRAVAPPRESYSTIACLELLFGPWQIVRLRGSSRTSPLAGNADHIVVYYRGPGETVDEFVYLIDAMFRLEQLREEHDVIEVRLVECSDNAKELWGRAVDAYVLKRHDFDSVRKRLSTIDVSSVTRVKPAFSATEIGLDQ